MVTSTARRPLDRAHGDDDPRPRLITRPLLVRFVSIVGAATSFYLLLAAVPEYARNTVVAPITVPVDVCGNAVAILGFADACCRGGAGVLFLDSFNG